MKLAIITGGARGIGLAIARRFYAEGYSISIWDLNPEHIDSQAEYFSDQMRFQVLRCDVSDVGQVQDAVKQVLIKFGRIHVLVNNAGVALFKPAQDINFTDWTYVLNTNLNGPFICTQACFPYLKLERGASVINIASISGVRASTLRLAYGTSKAALMHLTKQQAVEYGNAGVRVNAVAPGPVETEMAKLVHSADIRTSYADAIPLGRYGTVDEIAESVYFLASEKASYINGQILCADGGFDAAGVGLPALRIR
jgi:meso-butanediol dehydrogenase / (S,S)-butanediol dehydrogenase / diacetyl reductase